MGIILTLKNPLVFDTSALFNFGHRGEMELILKNLIQLYELMIPPSVEKQTQIKETYKTYYQKLIADYFIIKPVEFSTLSSKTIEMLVSRLGEVDTDVITLGINTKGTIVIDDRKARKEMKAIGVHHTGTIGLIYYSVQHKWLTREDAEIIVKKLNERGARLPLLKKGQSFENYFKSFGD